MLQSFYALRQAMAHTSAEQADIESELERLEREADQEPPSYGDDLPEIPVDRAIEDGLANAYFYDRWK